jgi:RNA polymerase sigma-70 factor, ECF subfamily
MIAKRGRYDDPLAEGDPIAHVASVVVPVQPLTRPEAATIERVYADHYRDVFRYVFGLTRSLDEAEEITADTFERAVRAWGGQLPARPVAWLLLTARRIATDRWRRARHFARIVVRAGAQRADALAGLDSAFGLWFDGLTTVLTARQREVLILRYQRDLTDEDIAAVMGLSPSGVRSLVARALAVLRSHPELL